MGNPPRQGAALTAAVKPGDAVLVRGDSPNSVVLKDYSIANAFGARLEPTEISVDGAPAMNLYGVR